MTDPRRRNVRPSESAFSTPRPTSEPTGETTVRAIRTPAAPAADSGVQVRPVRRPAGATSSLEALSGLETRPLPERPAQPAAQVRAVRRAPTPAELHRPEPQAQRPEALPADPVPAEEAPEPAAPRSGWLSHALNDWLQEPPASAPRQLSAPRQAATPADPEVRHARPQPSVRQVVGAEEVSRPTPALEQEALPLTLQEALASDLLPDLPVELLERLWQQEQAALAPEPDPEPEHTPPSYAAPEPARPARPAEGLPSGIGTAHGPGPSPQRPLSAMPAEASAVIPTLQPMFQGVSPFLGRFLPLSAPQQMGLNARFCDLHAFLKYLHDLSWYGYLHVAMGDLSTYALVYEGRVVAAAAVNATGEQALGELLSLYEQGATMATYPLPPTYAHVLSGVGSRAWKFDLTEDFTGLYADPEGALFYSRGEVVASMPAGLPYEGAFPAPLRPQTLILPRSFAGWAHQPYVLTLRGRDANNPITSVYHEFRSKYGEAGAQFIRALGEKQTPAEYAVRADVALHDLEAMLLEFAQGGYLKEQGH